MTDLIRSFAEGNAELVLSFIRYLEAYDRSPKTIRSYEDSCTRFAEFMGSRSALDATRTDVRTFLAGLFTKGVADNSVRLHTAALGSFYKFIRFSGPTGNDPTLSLPHTPSANLRMPRGPYSTRAIYNLIAKLGRRARIGHVYPHSLRRAMACHMLSSGAGIREIQELLGHTNLSTTQIYTHLTPEELKSIHERCHPHAQSEGGADGEETAS